MDQLVILGGSRLEGNLDISGAKNAALPVLAAALLTHDGVFLSNVPRLNDVSTMMALLRHLGARVTEREPGELRIEAAQLNEVRAPYDLVRTMRASFLVMGPLLARLGEAEVSLPGGCAIGARPVDQHLKAFEALGARISLADGYVRASAPDGLTGARVRLDMATVGGTENLLMAASLARGDTVIENAAQEPEVVDLGQFLETLGVRISGLGTPCIRISGVDHLSGGHYRIMPDRIEAGTYLVATAMTRGAVRLRGARADHLDAVLERLRDAGARIQADADWIELDQRDRPRSVAIETAPYPGFPTDMQAQFMALNAISAGRCRMTETIFENRFMHVQELKRLGAEIELSGASSVIVEGVPMLRAAPVMATDLRASSSLVLAGLVADGETRIQRIYHIDRGYERIEIKLARLGANVRRLPGNPATTGVQKPAQAVC